MVQSKIEAGVYRERSMTVNACRVKAIVRQPGLGIEKKTQLPEWVRDLAARHLIGVVRDSDRHVLEVVSPRQVKPMLATGTAWLIQSTTDERDLWVLEDKPFKALYHDGPTEREAELEEELRRSRSATRSAQDEADRLYPGERPGHDSMG